MPVLPDLHTIAPKGRRYPRSKIHAGLRQHLTLNDIGGL
jgi:hypothetical protein